MSIPVIDARPLFLYILSFDTLSFHVIFIISFRYRIIYAFSFFTCVLYTVHVSASYNSVERAIVFYILYFPRRNTASLAAFHKLRSPSPSERWAHYQVGHCLWWYFLGIQSSLSVQVPHHELEYQQVLYWCSLLVGIGTVFLIFILKLNWSAADENLSTSRCMLSALWATAISKKHFSYYLLWCFRSCFKVCNVEEICVVSGLATYTIQAIIKGNF